MKTTLTTVIAALGALWLLAACSRAHDPGDGASADGSESDSSSTDGSPMDSPSLEDSTPPDAAEVDCPTSCYATCGRGDLECRCSSGGGARCAGYVVHCPTGTQPPECTATGGIDCVSGVPGGGAEPPTCVRDTAPADPDCVPVCSPEGVFRCIDWRRSRPCEGHVVECPTAEEPPVCVEYGVRCVLPDGELERPVCVPG